jgi:hypothetical protein
MGRGLGVNISNFHHPNNFFQQLILRNSELEGDGPVGGQKNRNRTSLVKVMLVKRVNSFLKD